MTIYSRFVTRDARVVAFYSSLVTRDARVVTFHSRVVRPFWPVNRIFGATIWHSRSAVDEATPFDLNLWPETKPFTSCALTEEDARPAVAEDLLGRPGPHSIIDSGYLGDGWLRSNYFQTSTNDAVASTNGESRRPYGRFGGKNYPLFSLGAENVESDGIGIDFLHAR